ncbi:flagellar basal-body rod protein FlgG [Gracilibacillus ureilyticus]|uniref:Flagellar basal-body rod protein FlgG n=1 Tax=Gracilibacillus ureilyticus TaxID=531814 RepID=A0A1H9UMS5_9BACI|nr:flagellar hook-basal body protein [Gracilibacillus ureilyticus]SES10755.1 flagellar basal-body rod protein FlgG [Gracilibacillus ureilyticus]
MSRMAIQASVTMGQLQQKIDTIGNNIANLNTHGYKNREVNFSSLLSQQINAEEANDQRLTPDGIRVGAGARLGHTNINLKQGSIQNTDRALDVALLDANQLFQISVVENGIEETRYTRAGNFYLNPSEVEGQLMLVTSDGNPVIGNNGPIMIAEGMEDLKINENGDIEVTRNGVQQVEGQLSIVEAIRPRLLEATGSNNFRLSAETLANYNEDEIFAAVAQQDVQVKGGALETSNVDLSEQMTELIQTQRAYQFNAQSISMHDQMRGLINQLR